MKKISVFILLILICALSSCARTVELTRHEEQPSYVGGVTLLVSEISNGKAFDYYGELLEMGKCSRVYLPTEGKHTAEDGESFLCSVKEKSVILSIKQNVTTSLKFTFEIYSPDGELILCEDLTCLGNSTDTSLFDPEMSEAAVKYWNAVKATPEEYFASEGGN